MSRTLAIGLFIVFLLILGGSVAVLVGKAGSASSAQPSAQALFQRAEEQVRPSPAPPPPPSGHVESQTVTVDRTIQLPAPRSDARPGLDALTNQVVQQRVDRHKLVGAPPQETAEWQARVDQLQADHDKAVQDEVARLAREAPASGGNDFSTQLVPMITALTGLIGAIATLVVALRGTRQT